ncbi:MAG: hypothetical protein HYZ29_29485, partial [Myxococcales bacterium]|nr:hypothetical protein [Myxococcales bacterium]
MRRFLLASSSVLVVACSNVLGYDDVEFDSDAGATGGAAGGGGAAGAPTGGSAGASGGA